MQNLISFSSLFASIILFLLSSFIYLKGPRKILNLSFFFYFFVLAVWTFGIYGLVTGFESNILVWLKIMCAGVVFIPSTFLFFVLNLSSDDFKPRKIAIVGAFSLSLIYFLLSFTPHFFMGATRVKYGYVGNPGPGFIFPLFVLFVIAAMAYGHYFIFKELKSSRGNRLNQLRYVFIASIMFTIGGLAVVPTLLGLIMLGGFPLWNFTNIFYGFLTAYAITKHELMDIRLVISRAAAYGVVGILLIASFAGLNSFHMPITLAIFANAALGLFWAFFSHRLREFIQTPLEEKWITGWYDSNKLINEIAQKLVPVMEKEEIFKIIAEELKSTIKIKKIDIQSGKLNTPCPDVTPVKDGVIIPLSSSNGPEGLLSLGPKISEDPYDNKDITLFKTITIQAHAIFDRIRPYQKIKKEFEENQKKLYDAERQFERSSRLVSLGTTAAGVAHELRNPLAVISLKTQNLPDTDELKEFKNAVIENAERATGIIRQMLKLAKPQKKKKEIRADLNQVIESTLELFTISGIRLIKKLEALPRITCDPDEIKQVFINLIDNAIKAMPTGGDLTIRSFVKDKSAVCVEISDTGAGIPGEIKEKIFDPFFSTRHEGVGLGLPIAYRIVREHAGSLEAQSQPGKGTTFRIILTFVSSQNPA